MENTKISLEGKVALITGAAGGIGSAIVELFGAAGARLFLNGVNEEKLEKLSVSLQRKGIENRYKASDVKIAGAADALVRSVVEEMGKIDILVNSAGINRPQLSVDVTEKNWDDVMDINLKALFFLSQAAAKEMMKTGGGKIVNISSQAGIVALPLRAAYCASKGGVNHLTRTLAVEWAKHGINVNAVAPTFVQTPLTEGMFKDAAFKQYVLDSIPLGRMATGRECAYAALFLASDWAEMITGHVLTVDGGWTVK